MAPHWMTAKRLLANSETLVMMRILNLGPAHLNLFKPHAQVSNQLTNALMVLVMTVALVNGIENCASHVQSQVMGYILESNQTTCLTIAMPILMVSLLKK